MPVAVTAKLDKALSDRVVRLSREIEMRHPDFVPQPDYPPHITLAVVNEEISPDKLIKRLSKESCNMDRFPVVASHLGVFPGQPSYIFLAPVVTKTLLALHKMVAAVLPAGVIHPHYEIGCWVP
ncbi:MAG: 2'-5' RNA ligase family protein, partial [Alphaproteobacteria bacterium]|nr:2'-5' RNA ligase family protein [Alphaproteobacteria bacterium]